MKDNEHMHRGHRARLLAVAVVGALLATTVMASPGAAHPEGPAHHSPLPVHASPNMRAFAADHHEPDALPAAGATPCVSGFAGVYPCANVDLESFLPLADIGGTSAGAAANDIWGWTDAQTGREYAIVGRVFGTSFVDVTVASSPVYLGELPTHGPFGSSWRDIKVYADHAFIVSEALVHGMQVFDLTQLRGLTGPPVTFTETAHYATIWSAHNIAVNADTGYAYLLGVSGPNSCSGGLHMVDISTPTTPSFAGCFSSDGYTHDAQCVIYSGPDADHQGKEICLAANEDTITIVDVTDKSNPQQVSRTSYVGSAYTHQGWLTDDQAHFLLDDELDEQTDGHATRTWIWDVADLDAPTLVDVHDGTTTAIDHNQYIVGNRSYQANYRSGLRILDTADIAAGNLAEVGYFDVYPADDAAAFNGAWSTYPFFDSGIVIVSGIEQGLFVLRPTGAAVELPRVRPFGTVLLEGDSGTTTANLVVYLEDGNGDPVTSPTDVTIDYATVDIFPNPAVAEAGTDFVSTSGTLIIPAGATQATVPVDVIGDTVFEPNLLYGEWGLMAFSNVSANATLDTSFFGLGLFIILNDD